MAVCENVDGSKSKAHGFRAGVRQDSQIQNCQWHLMYTEEQDRRNADSANSTGRTRGREAIPGTKRGQ